MVEAQHGTTLATRQSASGRRQRRLGERLRHAGSTQSPAYPREYRYHEYMGLMRAMGASERTPLERQLVAGLLPHVGRGTSSDYGWRGEWLVVRYDRVATRLEALHQVQKAAHGTLSTATLLRTRLLGDDFLLTQGGGSATAASFDRLVGKSDHVHDVLDVAWDAIQFRARRPDVTTTPLLAHQFRRLCDTMVFNYPELLRPLGQPEDLVLRSATLDVWQLRPAVVGHEVWWRPVDSVHVRLGVVTSTEEATVWARTALHSNTVRFDRHEWLDPPAPLWTQQATTSAKKLLDAAHAMRCQSENAARQQRWHADAADIAEALEMTSWTAVHTLAGVPASHRLLFHRLKGRRIQGRDRTQQRRGCPHCPAAAQHGGTAVHIFWECPRAQLLWTQLLAQWKQAGFSGRDFRFATSRLARQGLVSPPSGTARPTIDRRYRRHSSRTPCGVETASIAHIAHDIALASRRGRGRRFVVT